MKPAPNNDARTMHQKLSALVAGGIGGESESAKAKLARLESRFDFTIPAEPEENDIFADVKITFIPGDYRRLFSFADEESDVAAFVKWAFRERFQCEGLIRNNGDGQSVWIECSDQSLPKMEHLAGVIRRAFSDLWKEYRDKPGVDPGCRRPFLLGIYDGMMDDPRAPGQLLPPVRATVKPSKAPEPMPAELEHFADFNRAVRKDCDSNDGRIYFIRYYWRGKKIAQSEPDLNQKALRAAFERLRKKYSRTRKAIAAAPGLSVHPYALAVELGRRIRLSTPIGEVIEALNDRAR